MPSCVKPTQMIDQERGTFEVSADTPAALQSALDIIRNMVREPEEGTTYRQVKVASVEKFGLFVEFLPEQQVSHIEAASGPKVFGFPWSES